MAFLLHDTVLDAPAAVIDNATALHICSGTPTDRATAVSQSLADVAVAPGDFTSANHATSGRQVTVAVKNGVTVDVTGTAAHYCLVDATTLLAMTEVDPASPGLTSGSTVNIPAVVFSFADPVVG